MAGSLRCNLTLVDSQRRENVYSLRRARPRPVADWLNRHWNTRLNLRKAAAEETLSLPQMEVDL